MASELWVNDSGVARQIREVWINDSGSARRIQEIWINHSGTARCVYVADLIAFSDQSYTSADPSHDSICQFSFLNSGLITGTLTDNNVSTVGTWITPATHASSYEIMVTVSLGTLTTGTTGAWLNLGTSRTWTLRRTIVGNSSVTATVQVRRASDGVVLDSATVLMFATV